MFSGWHHVNLITSDLERSVEFYTGILGLKLTMQTKIEDSDFNRAVGIPDAKVRAAFLEVPGTPTILEIFQYVTGSGKPIPKDQLASDVGFQHICFQVDDIDKAHAELQAKGVEFFTSPATIAKDHPDIAGVRFCYFTDPDGAIVEILQPPG